MSNFCMAMGSWPVPTLSSDSGSDSSLHLSALSTAPLQYPLACLGKTICNHMPPSAILKCLQHFQNPNNDKEYAVDRFRTVFTLLQSEAIFCINFIPKNPHGSSQVIHVMRCEEKQDPNEIPVYCHDAANLKYLLPVEKADRIFDLSKSEISQTVENLNSELRNIIQAALVCFLKDTEATGVALTLKPDADKPCVTYIWLK